MTDPAANVILNVDDTEVARYTKNRALRHAGFEVVDADAGQTALELVAQLQPALVLLDVRLPDMSGIDVCKRIKADWPSIMVLQTSATFTSPRDRVRGLEGGADAYLVQPIDPDELVAGVRALLRLHDAEEATRTLNDTLEQRIDERTRELYAANVRLLEQIAQREKAEAALVQSQKMEVMGQLTGAMAHDFNNLLAALAGYLQIIRHKTVDADILKLADKALLAADRGGKLTARLLAFSRTEKLSSEAVDVRQIVQSMEDWLRQSMGSTNRLHLAIEDGPLIATTDPNQLELALLNIVINARDAMPSGGNATIDVRRARIDAPDDDLGAGDYVVLRISDTGQGMAPDVASRAFDPFYTTKPAGRGTGLGLAQVYTLARQSQGSARIESVAGQGTTVTLWLGAGDPALLAPEGPITRSGELGSGERVLLVDDDADVLQAVSAMLAIAGYEMTTASSGQEALDLFDRVRPDVLILDFAMPGLDGTEIARRVRARDPTQPILFISAQVSLEALETGLPGARLLRKPFREAELTAAVRRCLAWRQQPD